MRNSDIVVIPAGKPGRPGESGILYVAAAFTIPATTTPVAMQVQYLPTGSAPAVLEGGYDLAIRCDAGFQIDGNYNNGNFTRSTPGTAQSVGAGAKAFVTANPFDPKKSQEVVVNRPALSAFILENLYRLPDGAGVKFEGFTVAGDIAMPPYIWDDDSTLTPDQIAIVKPAHITGPGRAIIQHNGFIHAEWFGGRTSQAVQKAINSIEKGTVYLAPGEWAWTSTVIIKKDIYIVGSGKATLLKPSNLPNAAMFANDMNIPGSVTGVAFKDFEVLYDGPLQNRSIHHFHLGNTYDILFEKIYFTALNQDKNSKSGVLLFKDDAALGNAGGSYQNYGSFVAKFDKCIWNVAQLDIRITDCVITNTAVWGNWLNFAIHVGTSSIQIIGCMITGPSIGPSRAGGIWIEDTDTGAKIHGARIIGNYFDGSYEQIDPVVALYIGGAGVSDSVIQDNWIWHADKGIVINGDTYALLISGNNFQGNGRRPNTAEPDIFIAAIANFRYSQIHGNTFTGVEASASAQSGPTYAIYAQGGSTGADQFNYIYRNTILPGPRYAADAISVPGSYILSDNIDGGNRGSSSNKYVARDVPANAQQAGFFSQINAAANAIVNTLIGGLGVSGSNTTGFALIQALVGATSDTIGWNFYTLVANVKQLAFKLHTDGVVEIPGGILKLGSRYQWYDSTGRLRASATKPTNLDTEGVVVGTQS